MAGTSATSTDGQSPVISRRTALFGLGAGALAAALSACTKGAAAPSLTPSQQAVSSSSVAVTAPTPQVVQDVTTLGAVGDGVTDDTAALARALAGLQAGQALRLPAGKTFCHSAVLVMNVAGTQLLGPGALRATNEQQSALKIDAANIVIDGVTLGIANTTQRWSTPDQHKLFLAAHPGIVIRDVTVTGSAAAGIFSLGASGFVIQRATVSDTRADGIHMTDGSASGTVDHPTIMRSGDDGVAVVSYLDDGKVCHDIQIIAPTVKSTTGGRGLSVVGGQNITYTDIDVSASSAAAVYIACEGGDSVTAPSEHIRVTGGTISGANTNASIDHGAVLVYSGRSGGGVTDVVISGLTITDTRAGASRQIGVVTDSGDPVAQISFENLRLAASPTPYQGNGPHSAIVLSGVTAAGAKVVLG